jgi:hypothetical protein
MRARLLIPAVAAAAVAVVAVGVDRGVQSADAAGPVRVTATQLKINQRISQAAVRRSNEALALLDPIRPNRPGKALGWASANLLNGAVTNAKIGTGAVSNTKLAGNAVTGGKVADGSLGTSDLADGAVTSGKLANASVTSGKLANGAVTEAALSQDVQSRLGSLFAVVNAAVPPAATTIARSRGATAVSRLEAGRYQVTFNQNVAGCAYTATAGDPGSGGAVTPQATAVSGSSNASAVIVRIAQIAGSPGAPADVPFHLVVTC